MPSIDWKALDAVYANSVPHVRSAPNENALAGRYLEVQFELAEERAAIMEIDGGLSRAKAEAYAFRKIEGN